MLIMHINKVNILMHYYAYYAYKKVIILMHYYAYYAYKQS